MSTNPPRPFQHSSKKESEKAVGNSQAATILCREGMIGVFYERSHTTRIPTPITVNFNSMYDAARVTISNVLTQYARPSNFDETIHSTSVQLASGIMRMTYMKLFYVNYDDQRFDACRPIPTPFEVPRAYALAISTLGRIKISGLPDELFLSPAPPVDADVRLGDAPWNPAAYSRAVEYAKKLGMHFNNVDLTVKKGSSWWLYRPYLQDGHFKLECPYPEENFTITTAAVALLFCCNDAGGLYNPIVDLATLGDRNFGSMVRDPPEDISANAFCAVIDGST